MESTPSPAPSLIAATNDTAALLATSDLTALFYRYYNSGVIVTPLVVSNISLIPTEVVSRLATFDLQFDQLDGSLQRALLWDAGYIYSPRPAASSRRLASSNASSSTSTNTSSSSSSSSSISPSASSDSPFLKIYTRGGVKMAAIVPTRTEMESAGCALQLCSSQNYGSTWRAVTCNDGDALLSVVHCAIAIPPSSDAQVATTSADGRARSVWTAWNAEDRGAADNDAISKAKLAAPDVNVAEFAWQPPSKGTTESRDQQKSTVRVLTIHTVPFSDEPAIGQCPPSRTDERGDLLPTVTIPCAPYDAVRATGSPSRTRRWLSATATDDFGSPWQQPASSQLLNSWLESVAPPKAAVTAPAPAPGSTTTPATATSRPPTTSDGNANGNGNGVSSTLPPSAGGGSINSRNRTNDGGFSLMNVIPIVVGALVFVAIAMGFVLLRKRRRSGGGAHGEDSELDADCGGLDDNCSTAYANSSLFKTEDAYVDGSGFLSPAAGSSDRSRRPPLQHDLPTDQEMMESNRSAVSLDTTTTTASSSDRRRGNPKALVMATLRRVISEPSSSKKPSKNAISRPSLDTEHLKLLQTDPNLSASRVSYDKIVFERVISTSQRYEVWLGQYEGEEIAVKRLVAPSSDSSSFVNNTRSLAALDDELSLAGADAAVAMAIAADEKMARALEAFVAEIQITASLEHPNLARFVGVAWARLPADSLCLLTEYQSNGDLRTYILHQQQQKNQQLTWPRHKLKWARGVADGLRYLHAQRPAVLHLELNSTHVLLSDRLQPKLIDFGERLSAEDWTQLRISGDETQLQQLSFPYWAAPEVLRGEGHLMASDVYSFGMVLVELDACKLPFSDSKNTSNGAKLRPFQLLNMVISGRLSPVVTTSCPVEIQEIITRCTVTVAANRPTMHEVVRMLALADYEMVV